MKFSRLFSIIILTCQLTVSYSQQNSDSLAKRHQEMMAIMMTTPKNPIKNIGISVSDGVNSLEVFGPYHVLGELMNVNILFVAKQKGLFKIGEALK